VTQSSGWRQEERMFGINHLSTGYKLSPAIKPVHAIVFCHFT